MEKFSKLKPEEKPVNTNNVAYKDKNLSIIKFEDWSVVSDHDVVICIPYLIELNKIVLRQEYVPSYKYADGQELHICLPGGIIEKGETPEQALLRELQEETGIVIRPNFKIEIDKPLFKSKGSANKYYMSIITLTESDYHEIAPDKTKEHKLDAAIKVDLKYINSLNISDVVTELMLEKFKKYANL